MKNEPKLTVCTCCLFIFFLFLVLWKMLITRCGGRVTEAIDASSLAKITDGYTPGHMVQAIQQILTERRIQQVCEIVCVILRYAL